MKTSMVVGGMALGLLLAASPAPAQTVEAGVVIRSGPLTGRVILGEPPPVVVYREPARWPRGPYWSWRNQYRPVVVYYDGDRYYDRWFGGRPGLRRLEVYQRGSRYYRWSDDRYHHRDRNDRYRDRDDRRSRHNWDD
jgi:hypothetical protein